MLTPAMHTANFANKHAFIVEDDAHNLMALGSLLRGYRIQFKRNTTGANVVQQLRQMRPHPDFVLLDMDLPHGDPFEIYEKLRADPVLRTIPVIATAEEAVMTTLRPLIEASGFDGTIIKPIAIPEFEKTLRSIMR